MIRLRACILCLVVTGLSASAAMSAPRLSAFFGDRMVLQHGRPVTIWGWSEADKAVVVEFADQRQETRAAHDGSWRVRLEPLQPNSEGTKLVVTSEGEATAINDVLVGEVWLCGGQSNMAWTLRATVHRDLEIASADYESIRFLRVPLTSRGAPQDDLPAVESSKQEGHWQPCTTEHVGNCTGVGYYFARRLHRVLKVPLGIVDVSWGGTMAQHWVAEDKLRPLETMQPYFAQYKTRLDQWKAWGGEEGAHRAYQEALAEWEKKRDAALKNKQRPPGRPNQGLYQDPRRQRHPAGMYNGMIYPIRQATFRGILFYQGENNSFGVSWKPFSRTFPLVIQQWRESLGDIPVGLIQIAGWSNRRSMTYDMNHHTNVVREIQFDVWRRTQNTGLIATYDTNTNQSIHPAAKQPVGDRAARWALSEVYDARTLDGREPIAWRGPVFHSHEIRDDKIVISFVDKTGRGLRLDQDDEAGFYISAEDRAFHHARARIIREDNEEKLLVWSEEVAQPVAVRYAWSNLPVGRLMNWAELPAYPFRTDDWPLTPHQSTGDYHRRPSGAESE